MKYLFFTLSLSLAFSLFSTQSTAQEYRWVSDVLYVPLRGGKGNQYRILDKGLKTGTRLTLVTADDGDWTEVKTQSGTTGFMRSQYLIDTPPAVEQLNTLRQKYDNLSEQYQTLKEQLTSTKGTKEAIGSELATTKANNMQLSTELEDIKRISAEAINLHSQHQELVHDYQMAQTELDVLKADNQRLKSDNRSRFMLSGAGAVLLGVLIALIVPRFQRRKRFSEWG